MVHTGVMDRGGLLLCTVNSITWTLLIPLIGLLHFFHFRGPRQRQPPSPSLGSGQEAASPTMSGLWTTMSGKCTWWYVYGSYRGVGVCMGPTGVLVCVWVLQGCWCVYGSFRGVGACMGPTGVLVCVWVLQGCWCVYGSFRGVGACMGPSGVLVRTRVVVRVWVLQGCWYHTQFDHLPVHHLPAPPQHPQLDSVWVTGV